MQSLSKSVCYSAGLRAAWSEVRVPVRAGNFSPHHRGQTGSGSHRVSYPMVIRDSFPGGKAVGVVKLTTHLHLVPRSKNVWRYNSTPQYAFIAWCLFKHRDNFTVSFTLSPSPPSSERLWGPPNLLSKGHWEGRSPAGGGCKRPGREAAHSPPFSA
jgi:hypothetical protein